MLEVASPPRCNARVPSLAASADFVEGTRVSLRGAVSDRQDSPWKGPTSLRGFYICLHLGLKLPNSERLIVGFLHLFASRH